MDWQTGWPLTEFLRIHVTTLRRERNVVECLGGERIPASHQPSNQATKQPRPNAKAGGINGGERDEVGVTEESMSAPPQAFRSQSSVWSVYSLACLAW